MNDFDLMLKELREIYYRDKKGTTIKCPHIACANNRNRECTLSCVEFEDVWDDDGNQYLDCKMFDWE